MYHPYHRRRRQLYCKKLERGNCCRGACAILPACFAHKWAGVCIYNGHQDPLNDPMRQHQDGGEQSDESDKVCKKKVTFLAVMTSTLLFREEDSTKAFLSQCDIYACGDDNLTTDLEFICKDGCVSAHQLILASHSQFIRQILNRFPSINLVLSSVQ